MLYAVALISFIFLIAIRFYSTYFRYFYIQGTSGIKNVNLRQIIAIYTSAYFKRPDWVLSYKTKKEKLVLSFSDSLSNLLLTIFLTSAAFAATQYYIDSHTELNMFKAVIWDIENTVRDIDSYLIWLKPIFPYDVLISLLFVFFSGLYVSLKRVSKGYNRYLKFVSTVVLIFTIFTSFTFFGVRLNKYENGRKENLAFHKAQIIRENQLLAHDIINEKEDQAIQEILSQPQVIELLKEYQQTVSNTDSLNLWHLENTELINEVAHLRNQIEQVNTQGHFMGVWSTLEKVKESEAEEIIRNAESKTNSNANEAASFEKFKSRKKDWFDRNISMESTAKARQRFEEYVARKPAIKSAIFTTYKEPIKKLWKGIYSQTFKELLRPLVESIAEIIPFFDEVFDATFHDHVADSAFELFEQFSTGNTSEVPRSFISKKMVQDITSEVNMSQNKLKYWNNKISTILTEGNNLINVAIDKNLKKLRAEDPWQDLRQQMLKEIENHPCPFIQGKKEEFRQELSDWEQYLIENKKSLYLSKTTNLETFFFDYAKERDNLMEAMARGTIWYKRWNLQLFGYRDYTLQNALHYYTEQNKLTGKIPLLDTLEEGASSCHGI